MKQRERERGRDSNGLEREREERTLLSLVVSELDLAKPSCEFSVRSLFSSFLFIFYFFLILFTAIIYMAVGEIKSRCTQSSPWRSLLIEFLAPCPPLHHPFRPGFPAPSPSVNRRHTCLCGYASLTTLCPCGYASVRA